MKTRRWAVVSVINKCILAPIGFWTTVGPSMLLALWNLDAWPLRSGARAAELLCLLSVTGIVALDKVTSMCGSSRAASSIQMWWWSQVWPGFVAGIADISPPYESTEQ